jgi:hypothetical protein
MLVRQPRLRPEARMFTPGMTRSGVVESPIDFTLSLIALNKSVAQFMKNHLAEIVIRIELIGGCNQDATLSIVRGISLGCSYDNESNPLGTLNPDMFEGIPIGVSGFANKH